MPARPARSTSSARRRAPPPSTRPTGPAGSSIRPISGSARIWPRSSQMLDLAMPEADITATPMNGMVLLTGTVAQPADAAEAERLVQAFVGTGITGGQPPAHGDSAAGLSAGPDRRGEPLARPRHRHQPACPRHERRLPVRHRPGPRLLAPSITAGRAARRRLHRQPRPAAPPSPPSPRAPRSAPPAACSGSTCSSALDLGETTGQVTTLAEPTLVALSGETATFLAGGEFPVPIPQSLGTGDDRI